MVSCETPVSSRGAYLPTSSRSSTSSRFGHRVSASEYSPARLCPRTVRLPGPTVLQWEITRNDPAQGAVRRLLARSGHEDAGTGVKGVSFQATPLASWRTIFKIIIKTRNCSLPGFLSLSHTMRFLTPRHKS